jgi:hypothetical protein
MGVRGGALGAVGIWDVRRLVLCAPARAIVALALSAGLWLTALHTAQAAEENEKPEVLETFVKGFERIDGLFTLYRDRQDGTLFMAIRTDQLGRDFIYSAHAENGVAGVGHFRGEQLSNQVIHLERHYQSVNFVSDNTRFYFDPRSALARAKDANISSAVLASAAVAAISADGKTLLVNADPVFLSEAFQQVKPSPDPEAKSGEAFALGKLSSAKTQFAALKNYPENTDLIVDYSYDNPEPLNYGDEDLTDGRYVTIRIHHSLIAPPPSDFEPRADDFRVGYFTERRTDMTSAAAAPYRDLINRWNLKKKDPGALISEPVKPITFWIENTTPLEFRDTIKAGILAWNRAFERAGFKNAIAVEVQPDEADWGAGDRRYNVVRWTSSPDPFFGGYGPSVTNPRTGEIISADIILEYVFVTNRVKRQELFESAALAPLEQARRGGPSATQNECGFARFLQHQTMLGIAALKAQGASEVEETRLIKESLMRLVLHEVGHTLGLMHNMRASSIRPFAELHATGPGAKPLAGSVMDYVPLNLAHKGALQGAYYDAAPGPYDLWAIEFGYAPPLADPVAEGNRTRAIVNRSTQAELAFGNDSDDMRDPGKGIDPRVMVGDLSSDPLTWADDRLKLVDETMLRLREKFPKQGESYQSLRQAFLILTAEDLEAASVVSRAIGGVYVERSVAGQPGAKTPYTPVPEATQRRALEILARRIFAPGAFSVPRGLAAFLSLQRRGQDLAGTTEDPKFHDRALAIQEEVLRHLLHPRVLQRLTDTSLYGNTYSPQAFLDDLTAAIFAADAQSEVSSFRRALQIEYVERLARPFTDDKAARTYDPVARAALYAQLERVREMSAPRLFFTKSAETEAHRAFVRHLIAVALKREE